MSRVYNVLVLCTGNSARSVMAEGLINVMGHGRFKAYSAGSKPTGIVNPLAIEQLQSIGYPTETLRSKSWNEFSGADAPHLDFVITVCDNAAGEVCPVWPGQPMTAHWGLEDPAAVEGSVEARQHAFSQALLILHRRISLFASLPIAKLDGMALKHELDEIGRGHRGES